MEKNFNLSLILLKIAGCIPFCVGLVYFVITVMGYQNLEWDFAHRKIAHIGFANLMVTGASIFSLTHFGIKTKQKWAWYLVLFALIWAGGNDTIAFLYTWINHEDFFPYPVIPTILGATGLYLSRPFIFQRNDN